MSFASEHPVSCAQRDAGCKASHPRSRWGAVKADRDGWFHSKAEECAYCPDHVPSWVPAWRARQAEKLHKVKRSFTALPAVVKCEGCTLHRTEPAGTDELMTGLRDLVWQHAQVTGHVVKVTMTREMTVEPADE